MPKHHKKSVRSHKKSKTQKLWSMKGCSLGKCKKCKSVQKGGTCGTCSLHHGGMKKRRTKRMLAYPASNSQSQQEFQKSYLAYTGKGGSANPIPNPNLPYGQIPPYNNEFPAGVSQPQNLGGGGVVNEKLLFGLNPQNGGMSNIGKWPDGLVGSPWTANINNWPGVDHISGNRNFLSHNDYKYDPQTENVINSRNPNILNGGKRRHSIRVKKLSRSRSRSRSISRSRSKRGGFFPQDLVNSGRQFAHFGSSTYNTLAGKPTTPSPLPFKDQFASTPSNINELKY